MRIKPRAGIKVKNPATNSIVPPEGIDVSEYSVFWQRVLIDGNFDVVVEDVTSVTNEPSKALDQKEPK